MGWLDRLFIQSDPRESGTSAGSGWLGPIAGGPIGFDQAHPTAAAAVPSAGPAGRQGVEPGPSIPLLGGTGRPGSSVSAGPFGQGGLGSASQDPGLLDRLTAGAANLTTGGNPLAGLLNAVNGLATGQRTDRSGIELAKQHATIGALMNAGLDLDTARAAAVNPEFLKALVVQHYGRRPMQGQVAMPPAAASQQSERKEPSAVGDLRESIALPGTAMPGVAGPRS